MSRLQRDVNVNYNSTPHLVTKSFDIRYQQEEVNVDEYESMRTKNVDEEDQ